MNSKSKIVQWIIKDGTYNWEHIATELAKPPYGIKVKIDKPFAIFNYSIGSDFSNPVVQEARGIIIDMLTLDIVCLPFRKFGNSYESYADTIDWPTARVQLKVDGSIMKLWWNYNEEKWQWSTNGCINAREARLQDSSDSFYGLVREADNYKDIRFDTLDKRYTYIFELTSPRNQVVIHQSNTHLTHIGTRNNETMEEINLDMGVDRPREFYFGDTSLDVLLDNVNKMGDIEGFVVVDKDWHRIKIKTDTYVRLHHIASRRTIIAEDFVEIMRANDEEEIHTIVNGNDYLRDRYFHWGEMYSLFYHHLRDFYDKYIYIYSREGLKNVPRKDFAMRVKDSPYSWFAFKTYNYGTSMSNLVDELSPKQLAQYLIMEDENNAICSTSQA